MLNTLAVVSLSVSAFGSGRARVAHGSGCKGTRWKYKKKSLIKKVPFVSEVSDALPEAVASAA